MKRVAGIYARYVYLYENRPWELPLKAPACTYEPGGPDY